VAVNVGLPTVIWVFDVARNLRTRLTFGASSAALPAWSPDGKFIAFFSDREGRAHLYEQAADGTGSTTPLVVDDAEEQTPSWSSDGRYLIFRRQARQSDSHWEIWALPLFGDRKAFPVVQSQFDLTGPALSPDGKWLAYASPESGRDEIYLVPFLGGSGKWLVSTNGGNRPRWRRDSKELFYLSLDDKLVAAEIFAAGSSPKVASVQPLFTLSKSILAGGQWPYDVSPDGKKFVAVSQGAQQAAASVTLVTNWPALLQKQ
jgi:dipeptidyl aminopeptidase/acylaminoacyl peptidase